MLSRPDATGVPTSIEPRTAHTKAQRSTDQNMKQSSTFGGLCDVGDIREVIKMNDLCDRLGVDTISTGNILGLLMDATEKGRIPEKFQITFGDTERMITFIEKIAQWDDEWWILGEGTKKIAEQFELQDLAIHVKGLRTCRL